MKIRISPLDKLFSQYVRLLADGKCEYCGKNMEFNRLQASHFHGRRKRSTRWDTDNAAGLCFSCHHYLQENPYQHTEWFKKRLGTRKFDELNVRAEIIFKPDKAKVEADLKEKIRLIEYMLNQ